MRSPRLLAIAALIALLAPPRQARGRRAALGLTLLRLALAPVMVVIGLLRGSGALAALALAAGFLSDVFDGVVARHFGASTAGLRRLDSAVDTAFYVAAAFCAWRLQPAAFEANAFWIGLVVVTQLVDHLAELAKFGREASYHAWSARMWGLALFAALMTLFAGGSGALLPVAVAFGLISHAETLAITIVLPEWRHDVPTVLHAWRIRRALA